VCVLLTGVYFLKYSEYCVMLINVCVIHVSVIYVVCFLMWSSVFLFTCSYNVHCICYGPVCMSHVLYVA
jgi:hypothetical protein